MNLKCGTNKKGKKFPLDLVYFFSKGQSCLEKGKILLVLSVFIKLVNYLKNSERKEKYNLLFVGKFLYRDRRLLEELKKKKKKLFTSDEAQLKIALCVFNLYEENTRNRL